jgi:adenine phosphoribosyltransferase
MTPDQLAQRVRDVQDFPVPGITFKDITTVLREPESFRESIDQLYQRVSIMAVDLVVGMESRGFIFAAPLAYRLNAGFVPVRKLGKLPAETLSIEYELEYGSNTLEIHRDAIGSGQRVLIVDDLLATGGTVSATIELVESLGGDVVACAFFAELTFLHGRDRLDGRNVISIIRY